MRVSCLFLQADTQICDFMSASSRDRSSDSFTLNKNQSPNDIVSSDAGKKNNTLSTFKIPHSPLG